jgi:heme-degrading monooxygenase HmoA
VLRRVVGGEAHFLLVSLWNSLESVRAFAGSDPEKARYYPEDDSFLLEKEPHVTHYEVLEAEGGGAWMRREGRCDPEIPFD